MSEHNEPERIQLSEALPDARKMLLELHKTVEKAATDAGLELTLIELVKVRASQINGCAYCLDLHAHDARRLGVSERKITLLPAWRETNLFTEQERAALELTEAMTTLPDRQDVPDAVYQQAIKVFTEPQYIAVGWAATVINAFNRLGVTSRKPLGKR